MTKPNRSKTVTTPSGAGSLAANVERLNAFREQYNPLRGLTLRRAVTLMESYFIGDMADLQWTYFFIEQTDPDLIALIELRMAALLEMDYNVKVAKDADKKLGEDQSASIRERCDDIDNLYEAIEHMGMVPFRGFGHCEKWIDSGRLKHLEIVDQWNAVRNGLRGAWRYNPQARSTTYKALSPDLDMRPEDFLYREVRRPINRYALLKFVRANLSEKDWDAFVEIYGIPSGVVTGPQNVPAGRENEYAETARKVAQGAPGYLPYGSTYTPNTAARGSQPFKERLDHLSEKLVLVGTGGRLTMLNGPTGLGGGQSEAHQETFQKIAAGDARRISETVQKQLVDGWLEEDFPGQPKVAYFELAANEETDVGEIIDHAAKLKSAGFVMDAKQLSEKTGYTITLASAPAAPDQTTPTETDTNEDPAKESEPEAAAAAAIANRATLAGTEARFLAQAAKQLDDAEQAAMKPLIERVVALYDLPDAEFQAAFAKLQKDLPKLEEQILNDHPELDEAFSDIIGTAMRSGMEEAAKARQSAKPAQIENSGPKTKKTAQRTTQRGKTSPRRF